MRVEAKLAVMTGAAASRRSGSSGRFALGPSEGAARSSAAAGTYRLAGVDHLVLLQAEDEPAERRRRSLKRGHDLLDALDRLKASLIAGRVPAADLARIVAALRATTGASGHHGLDDVLAHIELRAAVELAKLGRKA